MTVSILVFSATGDEDIDRAKDFALSYSAQFVDKLSSDMEDLILVANHGVVYTPTILILNGNKELARMRSIPDRSFMETMLATYRKT